MLGVKCDVWWSGAKLLIIVEIEGGTEREWRRARLENGRWVARLLMRAAWKGRG